LPSFTAANVYLGLKIGSPSQRRSRLLSFRWRSEGSDATIQETISSDHRVSGRDVVVIHLRAARPDHDRILDHAYWLSVAVIGIRGILGVMYSVPLRRALVTGTDLHTGRCGRRRSAEGQAV
jgi:hypothetical protein